MGVVAVILSPLCEVLIGMVANSQSQSLSYSQSRLNCKGHMLCRNSSCCDITILVLCLVDQCVCMALVSDIMLDGLTKTMEKLCTLVSELMLWITFWGGWVGGSGYGRAAMLGFRVVGRDEKKREKKSFLLLAIMLAFGVILKQTNNNNNK